ncbi:60S ribosomal protein L7a [Cavenderia fasciculata]|uniref:60S ribosomal protein L7a n=1 Tax=Cavenderia fasciculata TaxID=261658 RepID=F4PZE7_CACFS|nr:60S ribosomal protein L7a [Cavenderia fasciculata]EGG19176.1 60S ribosomal protein L7a [Cavenderia fasciculata]|eukprot:XP_004366809.1 60S ribosomal protein L7a [Cavenderia fasciculata]
MSTKKTVAPAKTVATKPAAPKVVKKAAGGKAVAAKKPRARFDAIYTLNKKRVFGTGHGVAPKRDVTYFTKWPRYVLIQRRRRVLMRRFKVPPTINQFTRVLDKNTATSLFKLLDKYRPEEAAAKKARLSKIAQERAAAPKGEKPQAPKEKAHVVRHGVDMVTRLVEKKKVKLVVIAHDVDPVELVISLPALCRRMDVPYVIVKSKSRLGQVVNLKKTSVVAITGVNQGDQHDLSLLVESAKNMYNNNVEHRKEWGGCQVSSKSKIRMAKRLKEKNLSNVKK